MPSYISDELASFLHSLPELYYLLDGRLNVSQKLYVGVVAFT
jgi:hypothetical protein